MASSLETTLRFTGSVLDVSTLMEDVQKRLAEEHAELGVDYLGRSCTLEKIISRFGGRYVSPTNMKGWLNCPAGAMWNIITPRKPGTVTSIGTTVHSILEKWYNLPGPERTEASLLAITAAQKLKDDQPSTDVDYYVDGFWHAGDYLTADDGSPAAMQHGNLECFNEVFYKMSGVAPLGVEIPVPIYSLIDRIDMREDGIHVVDYKTGRWFAKECSDMDHYGSQMVFYSWVVEAAYGIPVAGAWLMTPGDKARKWIPIDVHGLQNQSIVLEHIMEYLEELKSASASGLFPARRMQYCNGCPGKGHCPVFGAAVGEDIPVSIAYAAEPPEPTSSGQDGKEAGYA